MLTDKERYDELQAELQELYIRSFRARHSQTIKEYEARIDYLENLASTIPH